MGYYIGIAGAQQGPFELVDLPAKGLRADSLVWTDGMTDWKRADAVSEVAALLAPKTPIPPEPVGPPPGPVPQLQPIHTSNLQYQTPVRSQQNGMAVASLVLGILALPLMCARGFGLVCSILAIVFGFIARARARRENVGGEGMALAGIILGFLPLILLIFFAAIAMFFVVGRRSRWHF
jgi:hypothetical protein